MALERIAPGSSEVPYFKVQMNVIPVALALLPELVLKVLKQLYSNVSETAIENTKKTLQAHNEAHQRDEVIRRHKCHQAFSRTAQL